MKIFIGADHGGFEWKQLLVAELSAAGYEVEDCGAREHVDDDDYPIYAKTVAVKVIGEEPGEARGIVLSRDGQGMAIASNRHDGIRASIVWNVEGAIKSRTDNDSNILCLPADLMDWSGVMDVVNTWLKTEFSDEERHLRRIKQIDDFYPNS